MAKKRMFNLGVLETDSFMDMPLSAQALYFHLNLRADDDGFIGSPKRVVRTIGASEDDLKLLVAKRFVLAFEDGVIVIKHWRMHNAIRKDRYTRTNFYDDLALLKLKPNGSYTLDDNFPEIDEAEPFRIDTNNEETEDGIPDGNQMTDNGCQDDGQGLLSGCQTVASGIGIGIDIDKHLDKDINSTTGKEVAEDLPTIPLEDGTEWIVPEDYYLECVKCYPNLDIRQELIKMRMWSLSNPTKRKKRNGVKRFINNWLNSPKRTNPKDMDNGCSKNNGTSERLMGYEQ